MWSAKDFAGFGDMWHGIIGIKIFLRVNIPEITRDTRRVNYLQAVKMPFNQRHEKRRDEKRTDLLTMALREKRQLAGG